MSSRNRSSHKEKELAMDHDDYNVTSRLKHEELRMDNIAKNRTQQLEKSQQKQQYDLTLSEAKVGMLQQQRSAEEIDAISQAWNFFFFYC